MLPYWELTGPQRDLRLETALRLSAEARRTIVSIGMRKERTLHSVLKFYYEEDIDAQEIPIGPYIADIYHADPMEVLEIQTGSFGPLREKLTYFLPEMPVCVIYPVIRQKKLFWTDPATGEVTVSRTSPKKGRLYDILPELYRLGTLLWDPHLSFLPVLVDVDEIRLADGWGRDGRSGSHRLDRRPTAIGESALLNRPSDLAALLPPLPDEMTSKDLSRLLKMTGRALSYSISVLRAQSVLTVIRKEKNANIYAPGPAFLR